MRHVDSKLVRRMVRIPRGEFLMGSDRHYPEEAPVHRMSVDAFWIDVYAVTNAEFARFVEATGHVTLAERPARAEDYPGALPEMLEPGSIVFHKPDRPVDLRNHYNWWNYVKGASWRHPHGPQSSLEGLADHPVVHVAFEDAEAYAAWAGKELPTEAEWEYAARGGLERAEYAWGNVLRPGGQWMANYWQGRFPYEDTAEDGYEGTAPVGSFPPNGYGLHEMAGNVWEWTADWFRPHAEPQTSCCADDPRTPELRIPRRVMKGGSYLCAASYCHRYRPAARMAQPIDTSTCHVGIRCVVRDRR